MSDDFLGKPADGEDLCCAVRTITEVHRGQTQVRAMHHWFIRPSNRMEKVSAGSPPRSSGEGPAACTGAERSVTSAPTSKGARIRLLAFVRRRRPIDWLNSLIIGSHCVLPFIACRACFALSKPRPAFCFVSLQPNRRPAPTKG